MHEGYEQFLKQHNVTLDKILRFMVLLASTVSILSPVGGGERVETSKIFCKKLAIYSGSFPHTEKYCSPLHM